MSMDAMAPYKNKGPATKMFIVSKSGLVPVLEQQIIKETEKTYVLFDGTVIRKSSMRNEYQMFFLDKNIAETVYSYLHNAHYSNPEPITNMDTIKNCISPAALSLVLIDMIQELCEDGMPTQATVETWLMEKVEDTYHKQTDDTYNLENYDELFEGDTVYYIDHNGDVLHGKVFGIRRKGEDGRISYLTVDAPNDFCGFAGDRLGKVVFISEELAKQNAKK